MWRPPDEAVRVRLVSPIEHQLAVGQDGLGFAEVNHGRGEQADAGMTMLFVIPLEKLLTESAAILDAAEGDPRTQDGISWCGSDFPNKGCGRRRMAGCASW